MYQMWVHPWRSVCQGIFIFSLGSLDHSKPYRRFAELKHQSYFHNSIGSLLNVFPSLTHNFRNIKSLIYRAALKRKLSCPSSPRLSIFVSPSIPTLRTLGHARYAQNQTLLRICHSRSRYRQTANDVAGSTTASQADKLNGIL